MDKKQKQLKDLEQATKKHAEQERKKLIIDFDEAVAEENAEPIEVKFKGEVYALPSNPPAWLPLFINRHMNGTGLVDDKANLELITKLLGDDFAETIMNSGNEVSFEAVNKHILIPVMDHWGMDIEDASGEG